MRLFLGTSTGATAVGKSADLCEPFGVLFFLLDVTGVLCLEWSLLHLEERGVTSSTEATSKECLPDISKSPRGPLYSAQH